jgi:hypothetical protein
MVWALLCHKWQCPFIAHEVVSMGQQDEPDLAYLSDEYLFD